MAETTGASGAVTSWANNAKLVGSGSAPVSFTATMSAEEVDTTVLGASYASAQATLRSVEATWTTRIEAADIGISGVVSWASSFAYATNVDAWSLTIEQELVDKTQFVGASPATTDYWRQFFPGLIRWSGSYQAFLDDTTDPVIPAVTGDTTTTAALTLSHEDGTGTNTYTGDAIVRSFQASVSSPEANRITHEFVGNGDLDKTGTGVTFLTAESPLSFSSGALVLTTNTGNTLQGDAFVRRLRINCPATQIITCEVTAQSTGNWQISP